MKTSIQTLYVHKNEINFFFDKSNLPVIEINGQVYQSLPHLFIKFPLLFDCHCLERAAQIINFLAKGLEFQLIDNIEAYKDDYRERLESSQLELLSEMDEFTHDYIHFDLSSMHQPKLFDGCLVFFAKHDLTGFPYKVSLVFPINDENPDIDYELLPYL